MTTFFSRLRLAQGVNFGYDLTFEHKRIMALFPEAESPRSAFEVLWREGNERTVFIQSNVAPDLSLVASARGLAGTLDVRDDAAEITRRRLESGSVLLSARVNNVTRSAAGERPVPADSVDRWASDLFARHGMEFSSSQVTIERSKVLGRPGKSGKSVSAPSLLVEAVVTINDAEKAFAAWQGGVGRGKPHGFGLLAFRANPSTL